MRKAISDNLTAITPLSLHALEVLSKKGYFFVRVKGITVDKHYDHIEPHHLILIPMRGIPKDQADKDVYEPVDSDLLRTWAQEGNDSVKVFIAGNY